MLKTQLLKVLKVCNLFPQTAWYRRKRVVKIFGEMLKTCWKCVENSKSARNFIIYSYFINMELNFHKTRLVQVLKTQLLKVLKVCNLFPKTAWYRRKRLVKNFGEMLKTCWKIVENFQFHNFNTQISPRFDLFITLWKPFTNYS